LRHDLAFVHTAAVHIETFTQLVAELAPGLRLRHVVASELLEEARKDGSTDRLAQGVHAAMTEAASSGARVVVCTCSTIGGLAEATGGAFRSMRIDRAMTDSAVQYGRRVLVVAALEDTLDPTFALLRESARNVGVEVELSTLLVEGAWAKFERGDCEGYLGAVAEAVRTRRDRYDVVVLAQASMAPVAAQCSDGGVPILSSPRLGVEVAVRACLAKL